MTSLSGELDLAARLAARERAAGSPIMRQSWDKLLFLHWQVPVETLRNLIPEPLAIDTFEGKAWFTITPLTIFGVRPTFLPALPYLSWLHELNLRTYVYFDDVPGVWFFSLDANNLPAVLGARLFFHLPYFSAEISMKINDNDVSFRSLRTEGDAQFAANWTIGEEIPKASPGSLEFFLVERYALYAADDRHCYRCRIHHRPWPLHEAAQLSSFESSIAEASGLPTPIEKPLLQCGGPVDVDVWPLEIVADRH